MLRRSTLNKRHAFGAVAIVAMVLGCSGCYGCESLVAPALDHDQLDGATLSAPATATAGQIITLDATGSAVLGGEGTRTTTCPQMVRFFRRLPSGEFDFIGKRGSPTLGYATKGQICSVATGATLRFKVPPGSQPGTAVAEFAVDVTKFLTLPQTQGFAIPFPLASNAKAKVLVTTPPSAVVTPPNTGNSGSTGTGTGSGSGSSGSGGSGGSGGGSGTPQANQAPVARFFSSVDPSVQGDPIDLDARESFDRDGTITAYDWDYNGDGTFDETRTDGFGHTTAGSPGNRKIALRVHDDKGATSAVQTLDQLIVAPTTFTAGTFNSAFDVSVNTPFDVAVDNDVPGADVISLDSDDDGAFDDGQPAQTAGPGDTKPQFKGVQYAKGGFKRLAVMWAKSGSSDFTITTALVRVSPFENPPAIRAQAAAVRTRVSATLTPTSAIPVTRPKVSLNDTGVAVRGLVVRGRLKGKVRSKRKLPPGLKALTNADYAASFAGTVPRFPGSYGAPVGSGVLLARARRDPRTMVCLRVVQRSAENTRFTVLGATGRARGLRASGKFPPLLLDKKSRKTKAGRVTFTLSKGAPKALSPACRALVKRLPRRPQVAKLAAGLSGLLLGGAFVLVLRRRRLAEGDA